MKLGGEGFIKSHAESIYSLIYARTEMRESGPSKGYPKIVLSGKFLRWSPKGRLKGFQKSGLSGPSQGRPFGRPERVMETNKG
jgi:hypothetical protein